MNNDKWSLTFPNLADSNYFDDLPDFDQTQRLRRQIQSNIVTFFVIRTNKTESLWTSLRVSIGVGNLIWSERYAHMRYLNYRLINFASIVQSKTFFTEWGGLGRCTGMHVPSWFVVCTNRHKVHHSALSLVHLHVTNNLTRIDGRAIVGSTHECDIH